MTMRAPGTSGRRLTVAMLTAGAVVAGVAGCGSPELLDPTGDQLAADRDRLVDHMTRGLMAAGDQLGAGPPLATRVDTWCSAGTDNWKIHDLYRSTCRVSVDTGFALDVGLGEALGGIEGLRAFEERLTAEGWGSGGWELVGNDPGIEVSIADIVEDGRPITDVTGVRLWSCEGDGTFLSIGFIPGSDQVEPAQRGPGGYYADSQGENWQRAWSTQRREHQLLIRGGGDGVLAEQPW